MKIKKSGFTLIELLVVILIIAVLTLGVSSYNFRSASDRQTLETFTNKVMAEIETVRTNALVWKWMWTNLEVPDHWEIDITKSWSWKITTKYFYWATWTWYTIIPPTWLIINKIICNAEKKDLKINETWWISFTWGTYALKWNCLTNYNLLTLEFRYKDSYDTIQFNTVNWLIERIRPN